MVMQVGVVERSLLPGTQRKRSGNSSHPVLEILRRPVKAQQWNPAVPVLLHKPSIVRKPQVKRLAARNLAPLAKRRSNRMGMTEDTNTVQSITEKFAPACQQEQASRILESPHGFSFVACQDISRRLPVTRRPAQPRWRIIPGATIVLQDTLMQRHDSVVFTITLQIVRIPCRVLTQGKTVSLQGTRQATCATAMHTQDADHLLRQGERPGCIGRHKSRVAMA